MWWRKKKTSSINIAKKQKQRLQNASPVHSQRDNRTRLCNGKVLETNEQRVSKQNNHCHRDLNLYDSGTHSPMREIIIKFITCKPFVVNWKQEISLWTAGKANFSFIRKKKCGNCNSATEEQNWKLKREPSFFNFSNLVRTIKTAHQKNAVRERKKFSNN